MASLPKLPMLTGMHSPESLFGAKATQILEQKIGLLTQPSLIDQMVRDRLKGEGYEMVGKLPAERPEIERGPISKPSWNPLANMEHYTDEQGNVDYDRLWAAMSPQPGERAMAEKVTRPGPEVPTPEARPPLVSDERDYVPSAPFWRQVKDLSLLAAEKDPAYFVLSADALAEGMTLGNFKHLMGAVEKVIGKPGFYEKVKGSAQRHIKAKIGYRPEKAMGISRAIHTIEGALVPYSAILRGAGAVTAGASNIPILRALARAEVGGAVSGLLRAPEKEGALNRIQQIPGDVLFFTALETGALTFRQAKKIHDWNKQYKGKRPGVRQRVVSAEIGGEPGYTETRPLTLDELKKLFNRMQARTAGRTEYQGESLNWQQWEEDLSELLKGIPGWRQVFREGYRPGATIHHPGTPGMGFHTYALERDWFPRKPKLSDIFRRIGPGGVPIGEPPYEPIHPERDPFSERIRGERPRAEVPPEEAPPTAEAGPRPRVSGPVVLVDTTPKPGGGWTYRFRIPTEPTEAEAVKQVIDFNPTAELPPHLKEKVVIPPKPPRRKKPKGWANPLYQDIFDYGKIAPSRDYPDLHRIVPPGLLSKAGHKPDVLAQELSHKYPGIESDEDLYAMLEAINRGKAKFRNRETGEEFDAEPPEEFYEAQAEAFEEEPTLKQKADYGGKPFGAYIRSGRLTPQEYAQRKALRPRYEKWMEEYYALKRAKTPPEKRTTGEIRKVIAVPPDMPGEAVSAYELSDPDATWDEIIDYHRDKLPDNPEQYEAYRMSRWPEQRPEEVRDSIYSREEAEAGVLEEGFWPRGDDPYYVTPEGQVLPAEKFRVIKQLDAIAAAGRKFKYKDLFGKEVTVKSDEKPKKITFEQPKLFEMEEKPGKYPKPFDNRGLTRFDDVNTFRKQVQPALEEGYVVEYGHRAGARGWARIKEKLEPGKGRLVRGGIKVPEMGELREKAYPEPTLREEKLPAFNRDIAMAEIERVVRARWPGRDKSWVDNLVNEVVPDVIKRFKPEKGVKLSTYITEIFKKRYWPDGTRIVQKPEIPPAEREEFKKGGLAKPKPAKPPETLFEEKQIIERVRKTFKKVAKNKKRDPQILEDYILNEKTQEAIGEEHGVTKQRVNDILLEAIDEMKNDPDIIRLLNERHIKMGLGPMPSEKDLRRLAGWMSRYFSSRKGASYEIDLENDHRVGGYLSEIFLATLDAKPLDKWLKKQKSEAVNRLVYDVLRGHTPIESTSIPDDVAAVLNQMRQRIDMLTMQIVAHGGLKEQTKIGMMNNMGKYVRQMYRLHNDKHWDPPEEARQALIDRMKSDDPDRYGDMTNDEMNDILDRVIEQEQADSGFGGKAKQKRIPTESYIKRKELTEEWKNFAGIIEDRPIFSYLQTVTKQATMAHTAKFLNAIKRELPDLWARTVAGDPKREKWPRLPDTYGYGELAGKFVEPTLYKYITEEVDPAVSAIEKAFQKLIVNPFKATKTIFSVPTHARNFTGNTMFSIIMRNFILNPTNSPYYVDALRTFTLRNKGRRLEWAELVKIGVTETQFYGAEIPKFYNQLMKLDPIDWPEKIYHATVGKVIDKSGNLYNFEDALYRIAAHYKNTRHFGMSPDESVREINLGMTNYRKLPVMVDILRRWPVFGPFISFRWNVAKIIGNQFAQAGKEMAHKGTKGKGLYRLLRIIFALGIPTLLSEMSKRANDVDDEKIEELEKYYLDYRRNGIFIYFNWKGKLKALDLSYIYPTGEFEKGIRAAITGDITSMKEAMDLMAHPVLDAWSIMIQGRYPQWAGKIEGGFLGRVAEVAKLLWIPASAPVPSFKSLTESLKEGTFKPRAGKLTPYQIEAIIRAWNQEPDAWGRTRSFPEEVKNFFTGLRTWDVDPQKELARYMRMKQRQARDIMISEKMWLKRNTKSPNWEQIGRASKAIKELMKIQEDMKEAGELWQKLEESGWSLFKHETEPKALKKNELKWETKPKAINWKKILEEYN